MKIHGLDAEQSLASLKTTAAGLPAAEALRRLAEFGPNHVEEVAALRCGADFLLVDRNG
jgi:sodium/potassium-transporting ATPase subunit alpha